jgi:hypothetical protein
VPEQVGEPFGTVEVVQAREHRVVDDAGHDDPHERVEMQGAHERGAARRIDHEQHAHDGHDDVGQDREEAEEVGHAGRGRVEGGAGGRGRDRDLDHERDDDDHDVERVPDARRTGHGYTVLSGRPNGS